MRAIKVSNFADYLDKIESVLSKDYFTLYRGQTENKPLIPAIARNNPRLDTTSIEIEMLIELKRRASIFQTQNLKDDWDWLVFAQHYGMKTRLLDWTSNPLTALWFACFNKNKLEMDSYVYMLLLDEPDFLDKENDTNPFKTRSTKVLRPPQNNQRIIAQTGWFTAHRYSKSNEFLPLDQTKQFNKKTFCFVIPRNEKKDILKKLNSFGISYQTMYPDFEGICKQLNWEFQDRT